MAKRANGSGNVKRLPSGTWRGQLMDGWHDNGKRRIISFTAPTKAEVLDKIREYQNKRDVLGAALTQRMPFADWADAWYEDYRTEVQPSTHANYRYTLNILKDYFGDTEIKDIKTMHINRLLDHLVGIGLSQSYITKCRAMLIQIFAAAEANEMIASNPASKAKYSRNRNASQTQKICKDAFRKEEIVLLGKHLPDNLLGHSILALLGTGLRVQELLALQPEDIAEDGSTVTVSKAIKTVDGIPSLGMPKSAKGYRIVPVPPAYQQHTQYLRTHGGKERIWTSNRENELSSVSTFRNRYYRALDNIPGVRRLSPHCCRHTYISQLEAGGVPLEQIARLVGHSKIAVTDGYLHTSLDTLANAVTVLGNESEND